MVKAKQIAKVFKIQAPLDVMHVNQGFGQNLVPFYKKMGLNGHTGLDLRARKPEKIYAVTEGFINSAGVSSDGAKFIKLETRPFNVDGQIIKLEFLYYHLSKVKIKAGKMVKQGEVLGLTGNTGKYTTGAHLHFGMRVYFKVGKRWTYNGDNGYRGYFNPKPLIEFDWRLPVDKMYGRKRNWIIEYTFRFANTPAGVLVTPFLKKRIEDGRYIHRRLKNINRMPPLLTDRESNAIIYGGWDLETVLNPAMFVTWSQHKKYK